MLEIMSMMPATNVDGVLRISNTFSSLTSNPDELTADAAVRIKK
jgi:hypothetical protein